ncbi:MAG: hypothetical protein IKA17_10955 [Clostridia bacterium]|nr:hypothetical protein [Clostridia bacterium]
MNVKLELFALAISDAINSHIKHIDINADEIIRILDKYNIDTGFRHDF